MTIWIAVAGTVLVLTPLIWLAGGWLIAHLLLTRGGERCPERETPGDRNIESTELVIPVGKSHRLKGWMLRPERSLEQEDVGPAPCVVMVHGYGSHKDCLWTFPDAPGYEGSMLDQGAETLRAAGFHVVAVDLRNHGESDRYGHVTLGQCEADDVLATMEYLVAHAERLGIAADRIGLRGESMGAATCLIAAARDPEHRVRAIWCDSPFADAETVISDFLTYSGVWTGFAPAVRWWLRRLTKLHLRDSSPVEWVSQIECPVAIVHSKADRMTPVHHFRRFEASDWKRPPEYWLLDDHGHNRLWVEPDYHRRQIEFFRRHLSRS